MLRRCGNFSTHRFAGGNNWCFHRQILYGPIRTFLFMTNHLVMVYRYRRSVSVWMSSTIIYQICARILAKWNLFVRSIIQRLLQVLNSYPPFDPSIPHRGQPIQPQSIHSIPHRMTEFLPPNPTSPTSNSFYSSIYPRYSLESIAFMMENQVVFSHARIGDSRRPDEPQICRRAAL